MSEFLTSDIEQQAEKIGQVWNCDPSDVLLEGLNLFEAKKKHEALKLEIQTRIDNNEERIPAEEVFAELEARAHKRHQ